MAAVLDSRLKALLQSTFSRWRADTVNLQLSDDQAMLEATLERVFREHSTGPRIRAAEPVGFDQALWATLVGQGIPALRVPEDKGGGGMSLMHAVLAAEQAGLALASAPLVEAIVANRLLAVAGSGQAEALLGECLDGRAIVTLALRDAGREPQQLVPAGAVADAVICLEGDAVTIRRGVTRLDMLADGAGQTQHGAIAAQRLDLGRATSCIELPAARTAFEAMLAEWKLLTAALVALVARRAIDDAARYACEREAFGRRIGEYQGVSHALADAFVDVDGARMLVWRTADAIARRESGAAALLSMAWWWAASRSGDAALKALRVFGGYGATLEYDAQLCYRRAGAHALIAGDPERELLRAADLVFGPVAGRPTPAVALPDAGDVAIDFDWGPEAAAARERTRSFIARHGGAQMTRFMRDSLDGFDPQLHRQLAAEGLLYPEMPPEYGGPGLSGRSAAAIHETLAEAGWHLLVPGITGLVWRVIHHFGSDWMKQELLPQVATGDIHLALGYTEPSCGSDIFAAKTTATKAGDDWLINGQKMFTSSGHRSDYNLLITRTAPDKHRGLTLFIAPVKQPGYSVTEIRTIGDDRTNVTFYSDLRVPDRYRLGDVNGGTKILALALAIEQSGGGVYLGGLRQLCGAALAWARQDGAQGRPIDEPRVRLAIAEAVARSHVTDALSRRSIWNFEIGRVKKHEGPMVKLFGSESWSGCSQKLLRLAAPDTLLRGYAGAGLVEWSARRNIAATIYAGTSEVQRSLIAEAGLGLPRTRG